MDSLLSKLTIIQAPRTGNAKCHILSEVLFMAIAAGVGGANTWYEVVEFVEDRLDFFKKYLEFPGGVPSHDTFNRIFAIMDPTVLEANYRQWSAVFVKLKPGDVISIDGKTIKGAEHQGKKSFVHMVSAYQSEQGIALGKSK